MQDKVAKYKNHKELVDECVEAFLGVGDSALSQGRGRAVGFDGIDSETASQAARLAWSAVQRARLFCFEPERWLTMYRAADRYTTTQLAGLEWRSPRRSEIKTNPESVTVDNWMMWGISFQEAKQRGYLRPATQEELAGHQWMLGMSGHIITKEGREAFGKRIDKLPKDKREGVHAMLKIAQQASEEGNAQVVAIACAQIEDALYEENEPPEDTEKLITAYEEFGVHWPFPDPLPFDSCFFAFGKKLNLTYSPPALHSRVRPRELQSLGVTAVYLLGYLVGWEGDQPFIFTALQFGDDDHRNGVILDEQGKPLKARGIGFVKTYENGEWLQPMSLDPWIITMMVQAINNYKNIIENRVPTLTTRMARKKASKGHKQQLPLPAPFYMVNLKDELIEAPVKMPKVSCGRPVEWSHRWDVRGHECVRIERGTVPMDEKAVQRLQKRGYRIYEGMSITADDAARLLKRNIRAPGPKEWIAVLSYWREAFIKGPEDRPYIPAARVEGA